MLLLLLVNPVGSFYMCVCMYVMFVSIWWDPFFATSFCDLVFSLFSFSSPYSFFLRFFCLVMLLRVFLLLSLVCSRTMIIVIREIYKFDDRLDNDASVQVYYRLSMRMQKASAKASQSRLASSRDKATVDLGIPNRNVFCAYVCVCVCMYICSLFLLYVPGIYIRSVI